MAHFKLVPLDEAVVFPGMQATLPATIGTAVTITLTPAVVGDGKVTWQCKTTSDFKYVPAECRH